jgi:Bacterial SH3 domain/GDSL-like Lipase/Acylhydrolase family
MADGTGARIMNTASRRAFALWLMLFLFLFAPMVRAQDVALTPDAQVTADDKLRLRIAPSLESGVLTLLNPATPLTILGLSRDRDWLQVEIPDGDIGWVSAHYVDVFINLEAAFPDTRGRVRLPAAVADHVRQIYAAGQRLGNHAHVFAKVGDSITVSMLMLNPIGDGIYALGDYGYLQGVINFYRAAETRDGHNSFNDKSLAAQVGWTTYRVLNPDERDPDQCLDGESPLLCEYRVLKPSAALIMFGTNDVSVLTEDHYRANLNLIVQRTIDQGIIPILSTIPVRLGFEDRVQAFNRIIAEVARDHVIPLLDYGGAMLALGRAALDVDGAHPSVPPKGYAGAADFSAANLHYGYVIRNLTALQMLDAVWHVTAGAN